MAWSDDDQRSWRTVSTWNISVHQRTGCTAVSADRNSPPQLSHALVLMKVEDDALRDPKSFEDGLRVDLCAEISQVQIGRNVYGFTDVVIPKGLYPFLSTVDVLQLRLESCVLGESKCCCIVNLQSERHWERKT